MHESSFSMLMGLAMAGWPLTVRPASTSSSETLPVRKMIGRFLNDGSDWIRAEISPPEVSGMFISRIKRSGRAERTAERAFAAWFSHAISYTPVFSSANFKSCVIARSSSITRIFFFAICSCHPRASGDRVDSRFRGNDTLQFKLQCVVEFLVLDPLAYLP